MTWFGFCRQWSATMLMRTSVRLLFAWELWFAWRPVVAFTGRPDVRFQRVWLKRCYRRRHHRGRWQYKTLECVTSAAEMEPGHQRNEPENGR